MDEICNVLKEFISQSDKRSDTESISQSDKRSDTESISQSETPSDTGSISQSETPSDNSRRDSIIDLFKEYSASTKDKTEVNSKLKKINCNKLMTFDANVWFKYPTNMFFQPIPAKDKITYTNKEVEVEIVYEENFKTPPYRDYILILRDLRNKYKREGKNDYGDGGIIFGLYLAPKVKYNIILTSDGVLKEKKTLKGYFNNKTGVEDYIRLASGHDMSNEFNKRWERSFTNGIVIPKDDDKQKKVFKSYLNFVTRKLPNSEGIMYPYSDKDEYSFDENYEFDDFGYLYIQEENEECLITQ
ncbi:hypothetical protein LOTGIDRAFT_171341 [Lottia gigantea]|uniref:Uncharacterized protein n=1 Tax=Lottia gigantea TaxID=225164 RepID=V4BBW4_LOTGI|nr:hypothetical protein LOTGIDRAFT_171341 [Lottia gigantea]ESP03547.1 hypothetical protein LOTGIDRAFT_171341 [Lottia gigantea]